jgi:hypothetical protein
METVPCVTHSRSRAVINYRNYTKAMETVPWVTHSRSRAAINYRNYTEAMETVPCVTHTRPRAVNISPTSVLLRTPVHSPYLSVHTNSFTDNHVTIFKSDQRFDFVNIGT